MPNWTINKVYVDDLSVMKKKIFNDKGELDFDLIIPEPKHKAFCEPKYYVNENSHIQEDEDRPWFNWYDWHCDKWGVKWNCNYNKDAETENSFEFETAWSTPDPIIEQISRMFPDQIIEHEYAYEDDGYEEWYTERYKNGKHVGYADA